MCPVCPTTLSRTIKSVWMVRCGQWCRVTWRDPQQRVVKTRGWEWVRVPGGAQGGGALWGQWRPLPGRAGATNPGSAAPCSVQGNHCVVFTLKRHAAFPGHLPHRRFQKQNVLLRLLLLSHFPRRQEKAGVSGVVFTVMCGCAGRNLQKQQKGVRKLSWAGT